MEIRCLTSDDAAAYWKLRLEALQSDPEAFGSSAEEHQSLSLEEVRCRLGSGEGGFFVADAIDDGRLLGMAGFAREKSPKKRHKGWGWGVYVTPERRGAGLGRRIMEALETRRRDRWRGTGSALSCNTSGRRKRAISGAWIPVVRL